MSNTIYYVPIEPLEERYTEQWYRNFPIEFRKARYEVVTINGEALTNFVDVGAFLPMNSTVHYKNSQMMHIAKLFQEKMIKPYDTFFIADLEFWGIESLRLMSQLNNIPVRIYAFLHAASYTREDAFEVAAPYQQYTEVGWVALCDGVFVGSQYHKQAFIDRRLAPLNSTMLANKIHVTGNPIFADEYKWFDVEKKNQIIISNRFDWEKRPNLSLDLCYVLKKRHPDWNIVVTTSRPTFRSNKAWLTEMARGMEADGVITIMEGLTKDEYHKALAESKIMLTNSIEENFGYCIAEALVYNTYPLMRNSLSHPEFVMGNGTYLFDDESEVISKAEVLMECTHQVNHYVERYTKSIENMVKVMRYGYADSNIAMY